MSSVHNVAEMHALVHLLSTSTSHKCTRIVAKFSTIYAHAETLAANAMDKTRDYLDLMMVCSTRQDKYGRRYSATNW